MDDRCDLIYFSHRAWDELTPADTERAALTAEARGRRVFFVEEPVYERGPAFLSTRHSPDGVTIVQAGLPETIGTCDVPALVRDLIERLMDEEDITYCTVRFDSVCPPWFTRDFAPEIDDRPVGGWQQYAAMA